MPILPASAARSLPIAIMLYKICIRMYDVDSGAAAGARSDTRGIGGSGLSLSVPQRILAAFDARKTSDSENLAPILPSSLLLIRVASYT